MARDKGQDVPPQSQSQTGGVNENPNADVADGNQSTIQPCEGNDAASGATPSDGGNPAANPGGTNGTPTGNQ